MLLFLLQERVKDKDAKSEEEQLHFRQDDEAISVDVTDYGIEDGMHRRALFDLRRGGCRGSRSGLARRQHVG